MGTRQQSMDIQPATKQAHIMLAAIVFVVVPIAPSPILLKTVIVYLKGARSCVPWIEVFLRHTAVQGVLYGREPSLILTEDGLIS